MWSEEGTEGGMKWEKRDKSTDKQKAKKRGTKERNRGGGGASGRSRPGRRDL